ncbi:hypothetical protein RND81_01G175800 [Saponaria officinalis]|uniref:MULE transposase domain-containing protein n=1 Tax=Saponaria officinalis TaxID=3572 RepID=A0AAW1N8E1_SAPOF
MLGGVTPNAIVTDREQGLLEAVSLVFPESSHLLCVWHIDMAVEKYALELLKTEWMAKVISSKWWHKVRIANTVEEHERHWANLCNKWGGMVGYLTRTWMIHVDKWASCYTNHIMHFGNTATSRVESAHSVVKNWLNSATLTLDSIWTRVHAHIGQQHVEIRKHLENSRSTTLAVAQARLFSLLDGKVSHKAIKLMSEEFTRGTKLGMRLDIRCGCSMVSTHGLLCACQLHRLYQEDRPVHLDDVHVFWRTLRFDVVNAVPANDDVQLSEMFDEIRVGAPLEQNWRTGDLSSFRYMYLIPPIIEASLDRWYDPKGDGHCEFRVISHALRGSEDHYGMMRRALLEEIWDPTYVDVYGVFEYENTTFPRIQFPSDTPCGRDHWMISCDLTAFATKFNWIIILVSGE